MNEDGKAIAAIIGVAGVVVCLIAGVVGGVEVLKLRECASAGFALVDGNCEPPK